MRRTTKIGLTFVSFMLSVSFLEPTLGAIVGYCRVRDDLGWRLSKQSLINILMIPKVGEVIAGEFTHTHTHTHTYIYIYISDTRTPCV